MAAYPSYNQAIGSIRDEVDDRTIDQDVGGGVHIRAFFPTRKSRFTLKHFLTPTQWGHATTGLLKFYDDNRLLTFTFVWAVDNNTYTCVFGAAPRCNPTDPNLFEVTVDLRQV